MRLFFSLLPVSLLVGCSGYVADYLKPKAQLIAPHLAKYGITGSQSQCVEQRLTETMSVWQLRQLGDLAKRLTPGGANPASFQPWDFIYVAGLVEDGEVAGKTRGALQACNVPVQPVSQAPVATTLPPAQPAPDTPDPGPGPAPVPGTSAPGSASALFEEAPLWVNLGAAATGQGIAVDARSMTRQGGARQAWFRLLRMQGSQIVGETGYLLRVDCSSRTITAHAGRTYGAGGAVVQQKDYDKPEGPLKIESGTVIEVAYHALCDDPR